MSMKRIMALAAAAAMLLCGCGKADAEPGTEEHKTCAAVLSDKLDSEDYDISFTISGGDLDGLDVRIARHGDDGFVRMNNGGILSDYVKVDNVTTLLLPEICCYRDTDYPGAFGNAFIKLGAGDELVSESESDGIVTEVYRSPTGEGGAADTFTFEFDSSNGQLLRISQRLEGSEINVEMTSVSWECDPISLPDLSGWDNISDDAAVSDTAQIKFSLYYSFGLTEQGLNALGYTYDQIAHMKLSEQQQLFDELAAKLDRQ